MDYKIIEDERVVTFYKKYTDRKYKRITGIKFPRFGKYRHKMLVPIGMWGKIAKVYLAHGGYPPPDGNIITAEYVK